jgi:hypothetical protein
MDLAPGALNAGITNMQEAKDCTKGVQAVVNHSRFPIEIQKEADRSQFKKEPSEEK